ncbi:uncharacterized protein JCM15063_006155 [Sporobolomyces koalae]|uniref:uncharacterized protein n=1 Tax=Sporobolomyces koalae TaxID=500713 RepID=UPI00317424BD
MAALSQDRYEGAKFRERTESFAKSSYTPYAARPFASTSTLNQAANYATSSPAAAVRRPPAQVATSPARHVASGAAMEIGQAASYTGGKPIGRARSEVDIRSRSRRQINPATSTTPSTSPLLQKTARTVSSLSPSPSTPGLSPSRTDSAGSPASFVTARSIPLRTPPPPPRPTRSPHRELSPTVVKVDRKAALNPATSRAGESQTTLIHGTEFEIIQPIPPKQEFDTTSPSRTRAMSAFTFPRSRPPGSASPPSVPSREPASQQHQHQSNGSIFRLDRPHALPESYLAVRESLTQSQIDQFTLSLAAQFPASWTTSDTASDPSSSAVSSPTKGKTSGGGAKEGDTDDWARQRRLSSLISGLGMVLGSTSFTAGALLMEEEGEEEQGGQQDRTKRDSLVSQERFPDRDRRLSQGQHFELTRNRTSIDHEESVWATPRSRTTSVQHASPNRKPFHLDFDPDSFSPLTSGTIPLPLFAPHPVESPSKKPAAVQFGYATGGADSTAVALPVQTAATDAASASASPVKSFARQSWRLSYTGTGTRDAKPLSPKRRSVRPMSQGFDDSGLGINFEMLNFEAPQAKQSSYAPSSRPVLPRALSIDLFPETSSAPLSSRPADLPTSPPLVAEPATPVLTMTPALPAPGPPDDVATRDVSLRTEGPLATLLPTASASTSSPQPRSSSLAPSLAASTLSTLRRRTSHEDGFSGRRRSVLSASKSSKRISALFSSGMDKVRSRTSSHNSKDADDEREKDEGRTSRRRAITDGLISGPISGPALSASTSQTPLPHHTSASAARPDLQPPTPSTPLTQSPFQGRTWRSTLGLDDFEDLAHELGAMEMRRQEVIWELCETERSFVNGLRGVIQVFTLPLRTRAGTWIKGVPVPVSRLLDWLDDIVHLHSQIFEALEEARTAQYPVVAKIAEAFLPFVARLEVHQPYLVRFETVTRQIDHMSADPTSDFGEFVRMQISLPECGNLPLSSFLLKPVQRLMKYPLFFRQLCDLTPPTHPDHFSTLSLLHSTDSMIRVMQEVKTREDEYEETKLLESRISGLPNGFRLACRDRRLVAHGVLKRVHISDKDRSLLEMDAIARVGAERPTLRGNAPISPGLSPLVDSARPRSTVSDSSSSSLSVGSLTYGSDPSSGWNSPTTPGGFQSPSRFDFGSASSPLPSPFLRPDSLVSNSSSTYSEDSSKAVTSAFDAFSANRRPARRIVKTKAKESSVYVFVFSDLVVLATRPSAPAAAFGTRGKKALAEPTYRALDTVGLSRVLGVSDLSGKTEHEHLVEIDLLPIREGQEKTPLSLSNTSLASSIFLTLPPSNSSRSPLPPSASFDSQVKERIRWLQAFERSYLFALRSLSFPSMLSSFDPYPVTPVERLSCASYLDAGIVPKSPSQQQLEKISRGGNSETTEDGSELEREERGWWAIRLKKVRKEMEGHLGTGERRTDLGGSMSSWHPASSVKSHSTASRDTKRQVGARPGQLVSYSSGQVLPRRMD